MSASRPRHKLQDRGSDPDAFLETDRQAVVNCQIDIPRSPQHPYGQFGLETDQILDDYIAVSRRVDVPYYTTSLEGDWRLKYWIPMATEGSSAENLTMRYGLTALALANRDFTTRSASLSFMANARKRFAQFASTFSLAHARKLNLLQNIRQYEALLSCIMLFMQLDSTVLFGAELGASLGMAGQVIQHLWPCRNRLAASTLLLISIHHTYDLSECLTSGNPLRFSTCFFDEESQLATTKVASNMIEDLWAQTHRLWALTNLVTIVSDPSVSAVQELFTQIRDFECRFGENMPCGWKPILGLSVDCPFEDGPIGYRRPAFRLIHAHLCMFILILTSWFPILDLQLPRDRNKQYFRDLVFRSHAILLNSADMRSRKANTKHISQTFPAALIIAICASEVSEVLAGRQRWIMAALVSIGSNGYSIAVILTKVLKMSWRFSQKRNLPTISDLAEDLSFESDQYQWHSTSAKQFILACRHISQAGLRTSLGE